MRIINADAIEQVVFQICNKALTSLRDDVSDCIAKAAQKETNLIAKDILSAIIENNELARKESFPLCQDTGIAIFFVEIGGDVFIEGGNIRDAIENGMQKAYREKPFRMSTVFHPLFERINNQTNSPAIIHFDIVSGDRIKIIFLPKGGGAENMSKIKSFLPTTAKEEIVDFIVNTVKDAGGKPCPPLFVGVGIGGSFDYAALLAKKALLSMFDKQHKDSKHLAFENILLEKINQLGIGPMGLGGNTTALGVNVLFHPCHIASLPVAVNLQCHSHRYFAETI